jgi:hypothetical protein
MRRSLSLALPALALATAALSAQEAQAKGLMIITYGEAVMHYADLAPDVRQTLKDETGHELQVGYLYSNFGVFWLDLWTWGGEYVLYEGDDVLRLAPEEIAEMMKTTPDQLGKPLLYTFPLGLVVLFALGLGAVAWARISGGNKPAAAPTEPPAAEV